MPVTDDQVATLRAQLAGDSEQHYRLLGQLDRQAAGTGYAALVAAAFFEAVDRRFAGRATANDVISFVANVRSTAERVSEDIDPSAAERLILGALGEDVTVDDLDTRTKLGTQIVLLGALVVEERLNDAELDEFMTAARRTADQWIDKKAHG